MKDFYRNLFFIFFEIKRLLFKKKFFASIDLTNKCQLNCKHCYFIEKESTKEEKSNLEWINFFKILYKNGVRFVLLVGGEPTLRLNLIEKACQIFPFVDVITNGIIKIPEKYNVRIFLSIDGEKSLNQIIRGEKILDNILKNYFNDKRVTINFTFTEENYKSFDKVVSLAIENKIKKITCNIFTPNLKQKDYKFLDSKIRKEIIAELYKQKKLSPNLIRLNKKMIKWFETEDHTDKCYFRENVYHFDNYFHEKYCFSELDCKRCGCYSGASLTTKNPFYKKF